MTRSTLLWFHHTFSETTWITTTVRFMRCTPYTTKATKWVSGPSQLTHQWMVLTVSLRDGNTSHPSEYQSYHTSKNTLECFNGDSCIGWDTKYDSIYKHKQVDKWKLYKKGPSHFTRLTNKDLRRKTAPNLCGFHRGIEHFAAKNRKSSTLKLLFPVSLHFHMFQVLLGWIRDLTSL